MLLTISTTHRPATDLGRLLHKHPERAQSFSLPFGAARVFYPEATEERCTVALMLDVDPVGMLVEQEAEIGRRPMSGREGEEHSARLASRCSPVRRLRLA